jgi:hypothetical protein
MTKHALEMQLLGTLERTGAASDRPFEQRVLKVAAE